MRKAWKIANVIGISLLVGSIAVGSAAWVLTTYKHEFSLERAQRFYSVNFKQRTKAGGEKQLDFPEIQGLEVNSLIELPELPDRNDEDPQGRPYLWDFAGWALGSQTKTYRGTIRLSELSFDASSLFYLTFYAIFKENKDKVIFSVTSNLDSNSYSKTIPLSQNQNFLLFNLNAITGLGVKPEDKRVLASFTFHKGTGSEITKGINESIVLDEINFPKELGETGNHEISVYANFIDAE